MQFFKNMSGLLKSGMNLFSPVSLGLSSTYYGMQELRDYSKQKIVPSNVSINPGGDPSGYRNTATESPTITPWYKNWWNKAVSYGQATSKWFQGRYLSEYQKNWKGTLLQEGTKVFESGVSSIGGLLINKIQDKWGLQTRANTGDVLGNTPVVYPFSVSHQNKTLSKDAATEPFNLGLWDLMTKGSQPEGVFNLAYPQESPMPSSSAGTPGGTSITSIIIIIAIIGGIFFFLKKRGK